MDNFGYNNWNDSGSPSYLDTSDDYGYQYNPNKSTRDTNIIGNKNKSYTNNDSAYDFEISNDSFDASPTEYKGSSRNRRASTGASAAGSNSTTRYGGNLRRSSVDERTKEILERNKKIEKPAVEVDESRLKSFQDTYAELMEGLDVPDHKKTLATANQQQTPTGTPRSNKSPGFRSPRTNSSLESPMGTADSFEISAADLEVGALAARRAKEKASDRRKRMSLDRAPHEQHDPKRTSSPDITRVGALSPHNSMQGLQFSAALSSIHRSQSGAVAGGAGGEFRRFGVGSPERSDDDIYKMLNVTGGTDGSLQFGGTESKLWDGAPVSSREDSGRLTSRSRDEVHHISNRNRADSAMAAATEGNLPRRRSLTEMSDMTSGSEGNNKSNTEPRAAPKAVLPSVNNSSFRLNYEDDASGGSDEARSPPERSRDYGEKVTGAERTISIDRNPAATKAPAREEKDEDDDYEDEDEYSLDDFEQEVNATSNQSSPEKRPDSAPMPTGSSSNPSGGGLTTVEEIMQRWNSDSDFLKRSMHRVESSDKLTTSPVPEQENKTDEFVQSNSQSNLRESPSPSPSPVAKSSVSSSRASPAPDSVGKDTAGSEDAGSTTNQGIAALGMPSTDGDMSQKTTYSLQSGSTDAPAGLRLLNAVGTASMVTSIPPGAPTIMAEARSVGSNGIGAKSTIAFSQMTAGKPSFPAGESSKIPDNIFEISDSYSDFPDISNNERSVPISLPKNTISAHTNEAPSNTIAASKGPEQNLAYMTLDQLPIHELNENNEVKVTTAPPPPPPPQSDDQPDINNELPTTDEMEARAADSIVMNSGSADHKPSQNLTHGAPPARRATIASTDRSATLARQNFSKSTSKPSPFDFNYKPTRHYGSAGFDGFDEDADMNHRPKSPKAKMAPSTTEKLRQKQQRRIGSSRYRASTVASHTQSTAARDRQMQTRAAAAAALAESAQQREALVAAKQDNWRLSRKFERLEREMHDLRAAQLTANDTSIVGTDHSYKSGGSVLASSLAKRTRSDLGASVESRPARSHSTPRRSVHADTSTSNPISNSNGAGFRSFPTIGEDDNWSQHFQAAMQRLAQENAKLLEKEKALLVREEAVSLREVAVASRERMLAASAAGVNQANLLKSDVEKSELKETIAALKAKNETLEVEKASLKARLFEQKQNHDLATEEQLARESIDVRGQLDLVEENYKKLLSRTKENPAMQRSTARAGTGKEDGADNDTTENITVAKADYERVLKDHAELEVLVEGFQRENQKLAAQLKEAETEHQVRSALYFDERDQMNKELNRLRNMLRSGTGASFNLEGINPVFPSGKNDTSLPYDEVPVSGGLQSHRSAEILRAELQHDATIRLLKEKLAEAESGSGQREREMQATIEKLRKENRELASLATAAGSNSSAGISSGVDSDFLKMQSENNALTAEVSQLKSKLSWYIQNQKLLDSAEEEKIQWQSAAQALQKELLGKQGVDRRDIDRIMKTAIQNPQSKQQHRGMTQPQNDTSLLMDRSVASSVRTGVRQPRSFADIKKIKELEGIIRDLQESLSKRHPDSVANLIRAAATTNSDSQQQQRQYQARIDDLQSEIEDMKESHSRKLRSLRQEHDRVKDRYENLIKELQEQLQQFKKSEQHGKTVRPVTQTNVGERVASGSVRSLSEALTKISELETELDRVRTFYKKKVEDIQRKSEAQIRALKRGEQLAPNNPTEEEHQQDLKTSQQQQMHQLEELQKLTDHYTERISMLEKELLATAEELGRVKAGAESKSMIEPTSNEIIPSTAKQTNDIELRSAANGEREMLLKERERLDDIHRQQLAEIRSAHKEHVEQLQRNWNLERDGLMARIKDEQERYATLQQQLQRTSLMPAASMNVAPVIETKTPEFSQLQMMEQQINHLEQRLQRREKELNGAVEEAKGAQKMELARLQAIHAQECREKDEQLVKFQMELEQLVYALRQWQYNSSSPPLAAIEASVNPPSIT